MPEHNVRPTDVFPRRNLPGSAEQWGRTVEDRVAGVEEAVVAQRQDLQGLNRGTASQLEGISASLTRTASNLTRILETTQVIRTVVTGLDHNSTGFETSWLFDTPPDWATVAMVNTGIFQLPGGTLTNAEVSLTVHYDSPFSWQPSFYPGRYFAYEGFAYDYQDYVQTEQQFTAIMPINEGRWVSGDLFAYGTGYTSPSGSVSVEVVSSVTWIQ